MPCSKTRIALNILAKVAFRQRNGQLVVALEKGALVVLVDLCNLAKRSKRWPKVANANALGMKKTMWKRTMPFTPKSPQIIAVSVGLFETVLPTSFLPNAWKRSAPKPKHGLVLARSLNL
jgi:hypothetical protein